MSAVALRGSSGGWVPMNNVWGASWELPQAPSGPLDIQVTDPSGDTVRNAEMSTSSSTWFAEPTGASDEPSAVCITQDSQLQGLLLSGVEQPHMMTGGSA